VSNLWTMGQQFYVIRRNPAPGTPAAKAKAERDAHKAAKHGQPVPAAEAAQVVDEAPKAAPRQQPKKQSREQRKKGKPQPPAKPAGAGDQTNPEDEGDDK
jgi:YidC/Oxa1 family membrane protein insertase